jgi:hypothetical protein
MRVWVTSATSGDSMVTARAFAAFLFVGLLLAGYSQGSRTLSPESR